MPVAVPSFADVERAARVLAGAAHKTPVSTSRLFNERAGANVFFKCENFQRAGAFKFRGAYYAMSRLTAEERRRGVVTFSSGNHAQAIALAGQVLNIPRVIVMPSDAPTVKKNATADYGGEIVLYNRNEDDRETLGRTLANERGLTMIPPYDHADVVAGQGTAAYELFQEVGPLDFLLVPCGGGGLLSGSAISANELSPSCRVIGVEPAAGDDATRSFRTGTLQTIQDPQTVADGARTPSLSALTFGLVRRYVSDMVTIDDPALLRAMFFLWERLKLIVEPTGALGAAAVLEQAVPLKDARVGVILTGGNVDLSQVGQWLSCR